MNSVYFITFRYDKNECTAIATKYLANYMYWFNWGEKTQSLAPKTCFIPVFQV